MGKSLSTRLEASDLSGTMAPQVEPGAGSRQPGMRQRRRRWRMLLERDVAEIERRLRLYRENAPKRIAQDLHVHLNTVCSINLGRHPVQVRLRKD